MSDTSNYPYPTPDPNRSLSSQLQDILGPSSLYETPKVDRGFIGGPAQDFWNTLGTGVAATADFLFGGNRVANRPVYDPRTGKYVSPTQASAATTATTSAFTPPAQLTAEQAFRQIYGNAPSTGGYAGIAARQNAELERAAKEYWGNVQQYGQARSRALGDMYSRLASTTARSGADVGQRGLEAATSIEQLYQNLADRAVELSGGGGGMVTPQTATSGLVPVSGEVAMAEQQIPAAGASLADYLRGTAGAEAGGLEAISRAQAEQGVASVTEYLNQIAMAKMVADYERAQQMAANRARASAQASAARQQYEQGLREARLEDLRGSQAGYGTFNMYNIADPKGTFRKAVDERAKTAGISGAQWAFQNPQQAALLAAMDPNIAALTAQEK